MTQENGNNNKEKHKNASKADLAFEALFLHYIFLYFRFMPIVSALHLRLK